MAIAWTADKGWQDDPTPYKLILNEDGRIEWVRVGEQQPTTPCDGPLPPKKGTK